MTNGTGGAALRGLGAVLIASTLVLAACSGAGTPRPTDPRKILIDAVGATAALPTLRLHGEIAANTGAIGGQANAMTIALDADVDLATRQFAARATTQMPQNLGVGVQQVSEVIVTTTASFNRDTRTGRWSKFPIGPGGGLSGGPTNAQIATMITSLLSNPSTTFELGEAASCTLGAVRSRRRPHRRPDARSGAQSAARRADRRVERDDDPEFRHRGARGPVDIGHQRAANPDFGLRNVGADPAGDQQSRSADPDRASAGRDHRRPRGQLRRRRDRTRSDSRRIPRQRDRHACAARAGAFPALIRIAWGVEPGEQ
jgi:hypothetical protein